MVDSYQVISLLQNKSVSKNQQENMYWPQSYQLTRVPTESSDLSLMANSTQSVWDNFRAVCMRRPWCTSSTGHLSLQSSQTTPLQHLQQEECHKTLSWARWTFPINADKTQSRTHQHPQIIKSLWAHNCRQTGPRDRSDVTANLSSKCQLQLMPRSEV